jgi:hypothetical protein
MKLTKFVFALFALIATCLTLAQGMPEQDSYKRAWKFIRAHQLGSLGTISAQDPEMPNVSTATYMVTKSTKEIVMYLDVNAGHAKNMAKQPKISFMLSDQSLTGPKDLNDRARLTFYGKVRKITRESAEFAPLAKQYFKLFPDAVRYQDAAPNHEFAFYAFAPTRIFWIEGFGLVYPNIDLDTFWKAG